MKHAVTVENLFAPCGPYCAAAVAFRTTMTLHIYGRFRSPLRPPTWSPLPPPLPSPPPELPNPQLKICYLRLTRSHPAVQSFDLAARSSVSSTTATWLYCLSQSSWLQPAIYNTVCDNDSISIVHVHLVKNPSRGDQTGISGFWNPTAFQIDGWNRSSAENKGERDGTAVRLLRWASGSGFFCCILLSACSNRE